jgi:hypothetical protein
MALDPSEGPDSVWTRLPALRIPVSFVWAGRDALIPRRHRRDLARVLPRADQIEVPCAGHFVSGEHFRCMRHGIALGVAHTLEAEGSGAARRLRPGARTLAPCLAHARELDEEAAAPAPAEAPERARGGGK